MNTTLFVTIAIAATVPLIHAQQAAPELPLVHTTGTAEIKVVPDLADLSFEIEVRNADLVLARKQQAERAAKVLAALRAVGVAEADLQAADISISANFTEDRHENVETAEVRFFSVSQRVAITLRNLKTTPDVIAAAVGAGATGMSGVVLRTSELRKHRDAARAAAIKAAREKAGAAAAELGAKIGKPHRISEEATHRMDYGNVAFNSPQTALVEADVAAGGGGSTFTPGTISISASVSVSFLLE